MLSQTALENVILKGKNRLKARVLLGHLPVEVLKVSTIWGISHQQGWHLTPLRTHNPKYTTPMDSLEKQLGFPSLFKNTGQKKGDPSPAASIYTREADDGHHGLWSIAQRGTPVPKSTWSMQPALTDG